VPAVLITTRTTLALRCPDCGQPGFFPLSRFELNSGKHKVICSCGTHLATITKTGPKNFSLHVECPLCEARHQQTFKAFQLWGGGIQKVACELSGLEIALIGPKEQVRENIRLTDRPAKEMAEDLGYDKHFLNPEIMYQALDFLRELAEDGRLDCGCGAGHIDVEAYPDRIELFCTECEAVGILFAETIQDLQLLQGMKELQLEARAYRYLDQKRLCRRGPSKRNT
jgi:hypothetical protein